MQSVYDRPGTKIAQIRLRKPALDFASEPVYDGCLQHTLQMPCAMSSLAGPGSSAAVGSTVC